MSVGIVLEGLGMLEPPPVLVLLMRQAQAQAAGVEEVLRVCVWWACGYGLLSWLAVVFYPFAIPLPLWVCVLVFDVVAGVGSA